MLRPPNGGHMVSIPSLWLPIPLSAVAVFVASSLIHMVLPYHKSDYKRLPSEDGVMDALRPFDLPPGDSMFPMPNPGDMNTPAFLEKWSKGPAGSMTVLPKGPWSMGRNLSLWFVYCVVVGITAAYIAGRALPAGARYLAVFRFAGRRGVLPAPAPARACLRHRPAKWGSAASPSTRCATSRRF